MTFLERLMAKTDRDEQTGCWNYTGYLQDGYGRARLPVHKRGIRGRKVLVHRYVYEQTIGVVPDGMELDHLCRNRACCNPDHLEPVTSRENTLRGHWGVLHTHCVNGHEMTPGNTLWRQRNDRPAGKQRICRECQEQRDREYYAAKRADPAKWEAELARTREAKRRARRKSA